VRRLVTNSVHALQLLRQGAVHAAGIHLVDPETGEENTSFARRLLAGQAAEEYLGEPAVQALLGTLGDPWVRAQLAALGGYDTSRTGEVVGELAG